MSTSRLPLTANRLTTAVTWTSPRRAGRTWWLPALLLVATAVCATAGDFDYSTNSDDTITITGYSGAGGAVAIPDRIDGHTVTGIGEWAFIYGSSLTSVTIPDGVTGIGDSAFYYCYNLTSVALPASVTSIGHYAFGYCSNLPRVTFPASVVTIGEGTFYRCSKLARADFLGLAPDVGNQAFNGCAAGFTVYYTAGKGGFASPAWNGYPSAIRTLTITASDRGKTYGDAVDFAGTEFSAEGLLTGDAVAAVTLSSAGAAAGATVAGAPYPILPSAATGTGMDNYTIAYLPGALTVNRATLSATAHDTRRAYGAANPAFAGTLTGVGAGDAITASYASAAVAATPVGVYGPATAEAIISALADPDNRLPNYTVTLTNGTLTVEKAPLTITANSRSKTYGDTVAFAGTEYAAAGLRNGNAVTAVTLTSAGAATAAPVTGSPYTIVPSAAEGTGLDNYSIAYVNGALTIAKAALSITATGRSKTYGDTVVFAGTEFVAAGLLNGDAATTVTLTSTGAGAAATVAGAPYAIVPSAAVGPGLANYAITYVNGVLALGKAAQALTFSSCPLPSKAVGQAPFAVTATATSGLPVTFTSSNPAVATVAGNTVTLVSVGTTTITASQGGDANWDPATPSACDLTVVAAAADFVVTAIRLDPAVPAMGSTFTASVTVQNVGSKAASGGSLYAWLDRAAAATVGLQAEKAAVIGTLQQGQVKTVSFTALKAGTTAGQHIFRTFVDAKAQTPEVDEGNNQQALPWHAGRPDFIVTGVVFAPNPPPAGGTFTATVTVKNIGESAGDAGYVDAWANAPAAPVLASSLKGNSSATVGTLLPQQEKTLKLSNLKAAAVDTPQTFRAAIDSRTKTAESDEGNNQLTHSYQPGRPDFIVTKIEFAPDPVACGASFTAYATVKNSGAASGDAGYLDVWLNRPAAPVAGAATRGDKSATVGVLATGQEKRLTFTALKTSALPEDRVFRAFVDSRAKTVETDDTNNQSTKSYSCRP